MSQMGKIIADYFTNHGDDGAFVGDVGDVDDDEGQPRPGVLRYDGIIDTEDLAGHIHAAIIATAKTQEKALEDETRLMDAQRAVRRAEADVISTRGAERLAQEEADLALREARHTLAELNKELGD